MQRGIPIEGVPFCCMASVEAVTGRFYRRVVPEEKRRSLPIEIWIGSIFI